MQGIIHLRGGYPRYYEPYSSDNPPNISFEAARPADRLAADIKRRFLPDYVTLFSQRVAVKTKTEAEIAVTNAVLDELGALTGGRVVYAEKGKQGSVYLQDGRLDTYPHDPPGFHLDVRWLSLEMARRLCEMLVTG